MFSKLLGRRSGPIEYIVAGLGNPGKEYEQTRHNAGFLAMDYMAAQEHLVLKKLRFNALCVDGTMNGKRVLLMKPNTYMNKSGEAVIQAMQFYKIPPEKVIVLCDDISLNVGKMRVRRKGSAGGQNGLKNIIRLIGEEFPRVRIGIDPKPHEEMDLADWVLSKFTPKDKDKLSALCPDIHRAVELIIADDIDGAMSRFN